jgi:hypothetical protein
MLLYQSTQLPVIQAVISQVNSVFLQKFTQTYSKNFIFLISFSLLTDKPVTAELLLPAKNDSDFCILNHFLCILVSHLNSYYLPSFFSSVC